METEAKYYTPNLEEFFVGFEYEIIYEDEPPKAYEFDITDMLYAQSPETEESFGGICSKIENKQVRVKYLDSKDIEELGGVKISDHEYNINGCILQINCSDSTHITILEIRQEWEMTAIPSKTAEYYFPLFMGKIKNKSELKQVLKMIGVQ